MNSITGNYKQQKVITGLPLARFIELAVAGNIESGMGYSIGEFRIIILSKNLIIMRLGEDVRIYKKLGDSFPPLSQYISLN